MYYSICTTNSPYENNEKINVTYKKEMKRIDVRNYMENTIKRAHSEQDRIPFHGSLRIRILEVLNNYDAAHRRHRICHSYYTY